MSLKSIITIALTLCLSCPVLGAINMEPISSEFGICLKGHPELRIMLNSPTDVEFASLIYKSKVVGQFAITILGPEYNLSGSEIKTLKSGGIVLKHVNNDYIGVKEHYSGEAYPYVYMYLSLSRDRPAFLDKRSIMLALSPCGLKAMRNLNSPPKLDSMVKT